MQCNQCQENFFYNKSDLECQKCPHCYDIVQRGVDRHRLELKRLDALAQEILKNPDDFVNDNEFQGKIGIKGTDQDGRGPGSGKIFK